MNDELFKRNITLQVYLHLVKLAMRGETTNYKAIALEFNLPSTGNSLGSALSPILGDIYRFCESVSQPALTSIVVRKSGSEKDLPGPGFWTLYSSNHEKFTKSSKVGITARLQKVAFDYWGGLLSTTEKEVKEIAAKPRYFVAGNRCSCHPETCCCDDYAIYDRENNNEKVITAFKQETANEICDMYNLKGAV